MRLEHVNMLISCYFGAELDRNVFGYQQCNVRRKAEEGKQTSKISAALIRGVKIRFMDNSEFLAISAYALKRVDLT